jgi:hypothetical protein
MALAVLPWYRAGLVGAARKWAATVRRARRAGTSLGERYLEIRYEHLIAEPASELRRLCEFAGLPFTSQMLDYPALTGRHPTRHFALSRTPPQAGVRRWRDDLDPDDLALIEAITGRVMVQAGYEPVTTRTPLRVHVRDRLERQRARARARLVKRLDRMAPIA